MIQKNVDVLMFVHGIISTRKAGPYRIATEIRNAGYTCQIIEASWYFDNEELKKIIDTCVGDKTKLIAWSSPYASKPIQEQLGFGVREDLPVYETMPYIIELVKAVDPKIKLVVGGPTSHNYESIPGIDCIFYTYADAAILEYLKFIESGDPSFQYTINNHGKMVIDGAVCNRNWNFNNSVIKYDPSDNLFPNETLVVEVSRGCIFTCDFCSYPLNGKKNNEYIKNDEVLKSELLDNYERFGLTRYVVADDTFNDNNEKLIRIANIAQNLPFKLEVASYLRIDLLRSRPEQYSMLRDIGLIGATMGIESLNHDSAKSIGKGLHPDKVIEELYKFQDVMPDCGTFATFIVGLPFETKESVISTTQRILDDSFPVDSYTLYPLTIDYNRKHNLSAFEKDVGKYYKTNPNRPGWWHNGNFDYDWASKFFLDFIKSKESMDRQRVGGFRSVGWRNYYPDVPLAKKNHKDITITSAMFRNRLSEYKKMLFSD